MVENHGFSLLDNFLWRKTFKTVEFHDEQKLFPVFMMKNPDFLYWDGENAFFTRKPS